MAIMGQAFFRADKDRGTPTSLQRTSALLAIGFGLVLAACRPEADGDAAANWLHHGADHFSSKYAPLGQIDQQNHGTPTSLRKNQKIMGHPSQHYQESRTLLRRTRLWRQS